MKQILSWHQLINLRQEEKSFTTIVPNHKEIAIGTFNSIVKKFVRQPRGLHRKKVLDAWVYIQAYFFNYHLEAAQTLNSLI